MADLAPRFEDVPVEVARRVAQREKMKMRSGVSVCMICGGEVKLEQCKIDEEGGAVHEDCYSKKVRG